MKTPKLSSVAALILCGLTVACTYDQNPPPVPPPSSDETADLEAVYTTEAPNTLDAAYWTTADYIHVVPEEITKSEVLAEDGLLNMTGMFDGLSDFNKGDSTALRLKAAYDDEYIYILAEWFDQSYDISQRSWVYDGAVDPNKPAEATAGWTSQFNDDNLILDFDMTSGKRDVWKWSLAISEPLGYAIDMFDDGSGEEVDAGDILVIRNSNGSDNRTGPAFEWDGTDQEVSRPLSSGPTFLDPAFFLLNKTPFTGDPEIGQALFVQECSECHGDDGDGDGHDWNTGVSMKLPAFNRISRQGLDDLLSNSTHSGNTYWKSLNEVEEDHVIARLRGFSGVPGYYIDTDNLVAPDITAISTESLSRIDYKSRTKGSYKVLLVRPLNTGSGDDIQFDTSQLDPYSFNVYLMDNDDPNRVGALQKSLIFK